MGQPILGSMGMMRAADAFECGEYHKKRESLAPRPAPRLDVQLFLSSARDFVSD